MAAAGRRSGRIDRGRTRADPGFGSHQRGCRFRRPLRRARGAGRCSARTGRAASGTASSPPAPAAARAGASVPAAAEDRAGGRTRRRAAAFDRAREGQLRDRARPRRRSRQPRRAGAAGACPGRAAAERRPTPAAQGRLVVAAFRQRRVSRRLARRKTARQNRAVFFTRASLARSQAPPLAAPIEQPPDRRHQRAPSAFLISDAAMNGAMPTSHAFSTPSFMPNASQPNPAARMTMCPSAIATNSRSTDRSQPRSLSHPVTKAAATKPKRYPAVGPTSGARPPTGPANTGNPIGPFRQIGDDRCAAEPPAVGRADHQHDQRLQRHRHIGQRQVDLGRQASAAPFLARSGSRCATAATNHRRDAATARAASGKCDGATVSGVVLADTDGLLDVMAGADDVDERRSRAIRAIARCAPPLRASRRPSARRRSE